MNHPTRAKGTRKRLTGILVWLALFCSSASAELILGIHPYMDAGELKERFQPLASYLSQHLNQAVEIRVGTDYESHLDAIGLDQIDIAFLGPATYVRMVELYGPKPLLARLEGAGKPTFRGHIVVPRHSRTRYVEDLKGKIFAFGDPNSTMSRLVPQAMLKRAGVSLNALRGYTSYPGHNNVAIAVLAGDADAGALMEEVYRKYHRLGLRSLAQSPPISEHLFVASSRMDDTWIHQIRDLMLDLYGNQQVTRVLQPIKKSLTALVPVTDHDYDSLRELIRPLQ